jgi:hypothetical protein
VVHHICANDREVADRIGLPPTRAALEVRRDDFVKGSPENPWAEVFEELAALARAHVGATGDMFVAEFSTTGPVERAVQDSLLLGALQPFCSYTLRSLCGIPSLTLEGTADDWRRLAAGVRRFAALGLEWWVTLLTPLLEEFAAAAEGRVEKEFWQSIYKYNAESGGGDVHGWINLFFPYLKPRDGLPMQRNWLAEEIFDHIRSVSASSPGDGIGGGTAFDWRSLRELLAKNAGRHGPADDDANADEDADSLYLQMVTFPDGQDCKYGGIRTEHFPGGLVRVPLTWAFFETSYPMEFLTGFVGVRQDRQTLVLRPEIGWAVREAYAEPRPA